MIDIDRLRQLVDLMVEHDLTEVDVSDEDQSITIKRGMGGSFSVSPQPMAAVAPAAPVAAPAPAAPGASAPAAPAADDGLVAIESPMVGTFYSAPDPDSPPFAAQGASIGPDSVVCLVEAMKVFNEIKAETSGTIERVCVKDGDAIEFGQALFMVRPA
ncbi:MAG: acetyl-CoA carboxylase biotin carboxyl carrier protein [Planctomycetota bacterium]